MRCAPPNCTCRRRGGSVCSKPNKWNVFRAHHKGEHSAGELSRHYRRWKSTSNGGNVCAMAQEAGLDDCFGNYQSPSSAATSTTTAAGVKKTACDDIVESIPIPSNRRIQWKRIMLEVNRMRLPVAIVDYTLSQLERITNVIARELFGPHFLPYIRTHGWTLKTNDDTGNPASTGRHTKRHSEGKKFRYETQLSPRVFDVNWGIRGRRIQNDGNIMQTKKEWLCRVIAHELVHCLQLIICEAEVGPGGHPPSFLHLNDRLTGARGDYRWLPVF